MLYIFYGNDTEMSGKKISATLRDLEKKREKASLFRVEAKDLTKDFFNEFTGSQGLFEKKYIVHISYPFENVLSKETFLENLVQMSESEHAFLVQEGKINKEDLEKIKEYAQKVFEHKIAEQKNDGLLFSLTDSFGSRDKKQTWIKYRDAINGGASAEEIHGVLWWYIKTLYLALITKDETEAGMKPYPYNKAKRAVKNFKKEEIEERMQSLINIYHDAHLGKVNFENELETFILSL